jgi:hypothetical protein
LRATGGFSSKNSRSPSPTMLSTTPLTSLLPSLVLVWPSNCGFCILTEITAVRPFTHVFAADVGLEALHQALGLGVFTSVLVSAARNPPTCVPPSPC